jgi:hypothetical protein
MIIRHFFLAILLLAGVLQADTLRPGEIYSGPMKLSGSNLGASMMLPSGWIAQLQGSKGPLVLQSSSEESRIMIEANVSVFGNPARLLGEKQEYYGLKLFSATQIKQMRPSLMYRLYRVEGSSTFTRAIVYLIAGSGGRAVLLYGFFEPGQYAAMRQTMMTLADSFSFTAMRTLPEHMTSRHMQMAGGHYVFYERRGSFSEKREVWLCSDGTALFKGTYATANETTRGTVVRRGNWRLEGEQLILALEQGQQERYTITQEHNTLYFDKAQTFRLPNNICK